MFSKLHRLHFKGISWEDSVAHFPGDTLYFIKACTASLYPHGHTHDLYSFLLSGISATTIIEFQYRFSLPRHETHLKDVGMVFKLKGIQ